MSLRYRQMSSSYKRAVVAAAADAWWLSGGISASDCVQAIQPRGASSYADSLLDLSGNGNNVSEGVTPGWNTDDGWLFDGTDDFLDTGIIPVNDQSYSMIIQFQRYTWTTSLASPTLFGSNIGNGMQFYVELMNDTTSTSQVANGGIRFGFTYAVGEETDFVVTIAGNRAYANGTLHGSTIPTGSGDMYEIYIGCVNWYGGRARYMKAKVSAYAIYSTPITTEQEAAVRTAMNAL